jgi:Xaa-Pro aminopeptidase
LVKGKWGGMRAVALSCALLSLAVARSTAAVPPVQTDGEALAPEMPPIPAQREQARVRDAWLHQRLDTIVPRLMREQGVDMWILVAREYAEDPVVATMLDARSFHARRRTILVFFDPGRGRPVERLTVSRYGLAGFFAPVWRPESQPDQWRALGELVAARRPKRIAVNVSAASAFGDGLTHSQHEALVAALPEPYRARVTPADELAIGWLETRIPAETAEYPRIVRVAHAIIGEALSNRVIEPGRTTAADVQWWMRERVAALGLEVWFHPSLHILRAGVAEELQDDAVIRPGDMLWTDFGVMHMGLATDTQHLAYVLKPGERDAPAGLKAGLSGANRVQDALAAAFRTGRSGNEMLAEARARAIAAGLNPSIYSHPIGHHGHGAGAAIGFWDDQRASAAGERRLRADTAWSIELSHTAAVPEWGGRAVPFRLEEDAFFDGRRLRYLDGRQRAFHLIR